MPLSKKQREYIRRSNRRYNFKIGAVRSGKSYVDTAFIIPYRISQVRSKPGLAVIFGVSVSTIERNVLQPMRELYGDKNIGSIRGSKGTARIFGEDVWCIGTEKVSAVSKIQGMSIKYAYGDEIAKWNEEAFAMIESRLDKTYSMMDGACNPEGPNHWFKKWLDNPRLDAYIQQYVIFDNPFLPKNFIDNLCNEYAGTVYYDRYILGKWALAEGLIYPKYQTAIQRPPEKAMAGDFENYALSIDYGTQNAFAAILWGLWKGVWYGLKEYYWSGRDKGIQKTDEEYADDLDDFIRPVMDRRQEKYRKASDPFAAMEKMETIIDPSAASFIALLKKREWYKVRKADNDVLDGIRETSTAMYDGLIKISPEMKNWKDEIEGYIWDKKSGEDKPVKERDHLMDSMRYFVKTKHLVRRKRNADISGLTENWTDG